MPAVPADFVAAAAHMPALERRVIVDGHASAADLQSLLKVGEDDGRWRAGEVAAAKVLRVPNAVTVAETVALINALEEARDVTGDTVDNAPRHMRQLSIDELRSLLGPDAVARLTKLPARLIEHLGAAHVPAAWRDYVDDAQGGAWSGLVLIAVREYSRRTRPWIRLHHDSAAITVNIALSEDADVDGGALVAVLDGAVRRMVRSAGEATIHSSTLVHGVTSVTGEHPRHTLILFFYAEADAMRTRAAAAAHVMLAALFVVVILARLVSTASMSIRCAPRGARTLHHAE